VLHRQFSRKPEKLLQRSVGGTMAGIAIGAGIATGDIIGVGDIITADGDEGEASYE
jgi:hypothetical protein